jgi:predicted MPP superfamily phosphohydrolase
MYAVTGNHEYIGGVEEACAYLEKHGVKMLRDTAVKVNNSFYLIGREDLMINRLAHRKRKSLDEIMQGADKQYPLILMDHEPFGLDQARANGIDLQLSGHTHHGQLWPLNYITEMVYEKSWGYTQRGTTHYYISSGFGTWGPPVRLGNVPEILHITLHIAPGTK